MTKPKLINRLNWILYSHKEGGCKCVTCDTIREALSYLTSPPMVSGSTSCAKAEQRAAFGRRKEYKRW